MPRRVRGLPVIRHVRWAWHWWFWHRTWTVGGLVRGYCTALMGQFELPTAAEYSCDRCKDTRVIWDGTKVVRCPECG